MEGSFVFGFLWRSGLCVLSLGSDWVWSFSFGSSLKMILGV
jgi:hypothetical protein